MLPPDPATPALNEYERTKRGRFLKRLAAIYRVSRADAERMVRHQRRSSVRPSLLNGLSAAEVRERLAATGVELEPIRWYPDAFHVLGDKRVLAASTVVGDGHAFLQSASSFVPVLALDPRPGEAILDVCAAPGGKSSHIAALTANGAELWLNDISAPRVAKMRPLLDRYGVVPAQITTHPGQYVAKHIERKFDRVLLDAQCSGEGRLDFNHPRAMRFWSPGRIAKYAKLQKRMIASAYQLLVPGGTLVYATCTFAPEENEEAVDHLLRRFPEAVVEPPGIDLPAHRPGLRSWEGRSYDRAVGAAIRILPSDFNEGFFVARIVKGG